MFRPVITRLGASARPLSNIQRMSGSAGTEMSKNGSALSSGIFYRAQSALGPVGFSSAAPPSTPLLGMSVISASSHWSAALIRPALRPVLGPASWTGFSSASPGSNATKTATTAESEKSRLEAARLPPRSSSAIVGSLAGGKNGDGGDGKVEKKKKTLSASDVTDSYSGGSGNFDWAIVKTMSKYLWPADNPKHKRRVMLAVGLMISAKLANVVVPFTFKYAVDGLAPLAEGATPAELALGGLTFTPVMMLLAYGGVRAGSNLMQEMRNVVFAKVSQTAIRNLANQTFAHLHNMDLAWHLGRQTGALSRAIDRGSRGINFLLSSILFHLVPTTLEIGLVSYILTSRFGPEFAGVAVGTIGAYTVWTLGITQWRTQFRKDMNAADNEAATRVVDSLINYETVKYFGNEKHELSRFDEAQSKFEASSLKTTDSLALLNFGQNAIFSSALAAMMVMSAQGIQNGTMTVGDLVMVNTLLAQLAFPLNFLGTVYRELRQSLIDMETMFKLLDSSAAIKDRENAIELPHVRGEVEFDNVKFAYSDDEDRTIFSQLSFKVPAGQKVGIVGMSGSGKSTIGRLLFRFFDPSEGTVRVDGIDIRDIKQDELRKHIAVVPQDTVLFNETIGYNVGYGKLGASHEEIEAAAKSAQIHKTIESMTNGYDTLVGERGLKLSGGEKQRVSIARAILKDPAICLFDEATSALDTQTEAEITGSLNTLARSRTTLVIAHRLSTVIDADQILVLGGGGVIESGTHGELLAKNGVYTAMWEQQHDENPEELDSDIAKTLRE